MSSSSLTDLSLHPLKMFSMLWTRHIRKDQVFYNKASQEHTLLEPSTDNIIISMSSVKGMRNTSEEDWIFIILEDPLLVL